jgi:outer membrane receptor protein involved in Fe transport
MKIRQSVALSFLTFLLAVSPTLVAQTITTGDLVGTVMDATGAIVAGSTVTLTSAETGEMRNETTGANGQFHFSFLRPGPYTISAVSPSLKSDLSRVEVQVGQQLDLKLVAKVQATQQTVEVTADAALVDTETANLASTYSAKQVEELPAPGGDMTTVAFTAPGIVVSTGSGYGNFSSHGLPGTSNLFTINGNDYNDPYLNLNNSGASNLLLGSNEVAEASVVQNAYSVQYGRQAGAQVNYITRSGTNGFHGDLLYNYNGDIMNANDFFNNANGVPRPRAVSNQWGARIGGPVKKDKLFFFMDSEGLRYTLPSTGTVVIPSPQLQQYILTQIQPSQVALYQNAFNLWNNAPGHAAAVPVTTGGLNTQDASGNLGCGNSFSNVANGFAPVTAPGGGIFGQTVSCADAWVANGSNTNREWLMTARVDYNINEKNKVNFRFKTDNGFQPTGTNLIDPTFNLQSIQPQREGQVNWTYIISPTTVNNFIGSVLWYSAIFGPASDSAALSAFPTNWNFGDGGANGGSFYGMGVYWGAFPQGRDVGQGQIIDDISLTKGSHTLKFGLNYRKNQVTDHGLQEDLNGFYAFNSLTQFVDGVTGADSTGLSYYYQNFSTLAAAHIRFYNAGFYAQDEWQIRPNLKLTYGLRLDRTGNPSCLDKCFSLLSEPFTSSGYQANVNTPYNSTIETGLTHAYYGIDPVTPQPRVGLVYSPMGAHGPTFRAGGGIFDDVPPGFIVSSVFSNAPNLYGSFVDSGTVAALGATSTSTAPGQAAAAYNAFASGFANGATLASLSASVPGFSAPGFFSIPATLHIPKYAEWSFEIEQPLGHRSVLVATYAGNHGYDLLLSNGFANAGTSTGSLTGFAGIPVDQPDPRFGTVTQLTNSGYSNYDGLTVQFRRSFSYGFQGQINYTWSHALDTLSNGGSGLPYNYNFSQTSLNSPSVTNNYSNADYDVRHSLLADFVWDTPFKPHNHLVNWLAAWTLSGKFYVRTGSPFSVVDSELGGLVSPYLSGNILATVVGNPNRVCGPSAVNTACFSTSDFVTAGNETAFGNFPRNSFYGPGYTDVDLSLYKKINIRENIFFQFGASAYNLFNHPNFANPNANVAVPGLGMITSTAIPPTSAYGAFQGSAVSGRVMVVTGRFEF